MTLNDSSMYESEPDDWAEDYWWNERYRDATFVFKQQDEEESK